MNDSQQRDFTSWLEASRAECGQRPRFIVLASPLVPWFAAAAREPEYAIRSDAWQRFPASFDWFIEQIFKDGTSQLVLLCGDFHIFADCTIEISDTNGVTVACRCVTTSGVYCPYTFANTSADELLMNAVGRAGSLTWRYRMTSVQSGSGYTVIEASAAGLGKVRFVQARDSQVAAEPMTLNTDDDRMLSTI